MEKPVVKKRILQVCRLTPLWGMDLFQALTHAFSAPHEEVTTVFLAGEPQPALPDRYRGKVLFFQLDRHRWWWRWQAFWHLRRLCKANYFDRVICHHYKPTWIMHAVAATVKVGRLFSMHHNFGNFARRLQRRSLQRWQKRWQFITVSNALKEELQTYHVSGACIAVLPNAVDILRLQRQQYSRVAARRQCGLPENALIFITLGRLVADKGHLFLIDVFEQLLQRYPASPAIHLVIIGKGELEEKLRQRMQTSPCHQQLHLMTEMAPHGAHYLAAGDVFVLPSRQEAFGLVLLEAMCAKLPIIASRVGGIPQASSPATLLVPADDPQAWVQAMAHYVTMSASQRQVCGEAHYQYFLENFSLANYYQRVREVIQ